MNSKYGEIPDVMCYNFLSRLIDKLFKIMPLKECHSETVENYITDLIFELSGNAEIFNISNYNPKVLDIICILESIKNEDMSHAEYRRNIFKCISITKQLKEHISDEVKRNAEHMGTL